MRITRSLLFASCCLMLAVAGCSGSGTQNNDAGNADTGHPNTGDAGHDAGVDGGGSDAGDAGDAGTPDVCVPNPCDPNATCTENPATKEAVCTCNSDYVGDGKTCEKKICVAMPCDANAACAPSQDNSARSCTCDPGYIGSGEPGDCNADPCAVMTGGHGPCDPNATCTRSSNAAVCTCNLGYIGDGKYNPNMPGCLQDVCDTNNGGCDSNATCQNSPSGAICTCKSGFTGGGAAGDCKDVDECQQTPSVCPDPNDVCTNTPGSYTCACGPGWTGDPAHCVIDPPCNHALCPTNSVCMNGNAGTYTCACKPGYAMGTDPATMMPVCADINECDTNNGGCPMDQTCVNDPGSFHCACSAGTTGTVGTGGSAATCHSGYTAPLACGDWHACSVGTDGSMWCWGDNTYGEWGNGTNWDETALLNAHMPYPPQPASGPQKVGGGTNWTFVASGQYFSCGIQADGSMWCWGANFYGNAGNGYDVGTNCNVNPVASGSICTNSMITPSPVVSDPTPVFGTLPPALTLGLGMNHACAVLNDHTLWCWGADDHGQLGDGMTTPLCNPPGCTEPPQQNTPEKVGTDANWLAVAGGASHTCAIKTNGSLWCWGRNENGQLGTGDTTEYHTPKQVASPANVSMSLKWTAVAAREDQTCGIAGGQLYCWGTNSYGEQGNCATVGLGNYSTTPTQVGTGTNWQSVSVAAYGACGTQVDGTVWCWGYNAFGQNGQGSNLIDNCRPKQVGTDTTWLGTCSGEYFNCAVRQDNTAECWGKNDYSQLGNASYNDSFSPVAVQ